MRDQTDLLVAENQRLKRELHVLGEIAASVAGSLDLDEILARSLTRIAGALRAESAIVRLRDDATGEFAVRSWVGLSAEQLAAARQHGAGAWPSDRVIATGRSVLVRDLLAEPWMQALSCEQPVRGVAAVPIVYADRLVGTLAVGSTSPGAFAEGDRRLLLTIAGHLGIAVTNAQLYARVSTGKVEWERTCDAIADAIALFDRSGRLVRANSALAASGGWDITETRGRSCDEVGFCAGAHPACAVGRAIQMRAASREEITRAGGEIFSVTTLPIGDRSSRVAAVQIAKNVTEEIRHARQRQALCNDVAQANARLTATVDRLRAVQAQLIQSEKLAAVGQLVAGVAHELNNPLTGIIGFSQLAADEIARLATDDRFAQAREDVQRISEESERAARIVKNLLAFARQQSGKRAVHVLPDLVSTVVELRAYEFRLNGITVEIALEPELPPISCDANQIQQALLNILLNAEQAVMERAGGRIQIAARYDADAQAVVVSLSDNGPGIPPDVLSRVFDPFFTTKPVGRGTGLGLSICYGIVRDHGGHIWAESEPGVRTTFWVELPARLPGAERDPMRLLVAQADPPARDFVNAVLKGWGHDVIVPASRTEAFDRLAEADVLVVDRGALQEDPAAWRRELTGRAAGLPVLAVGIGGDTEEAGRLARECALAFLEPPFQLKALSAALRALSKELV